jgi:putative DNA primase/helicase
MAEPPEAPAKDEQKKERKQRKAKSVPATLGDISKNDIIPVFPHVVNKKPQATIENLRHLFQLRNIRCRYNVISKRILFDIPNERYSVENGDEVALALIYSYMKEIEMSTDGYKAYTLRIADENQSNPVLDMIKSKRWDGKDRLQALYDTIESPEKEAKELLLRRWFITCVCMAMGEGVDSAGCIVLQGAQDLGKTWWVRKLVPESYRKELIRTDATVDPRDKDSVSQIISYWIVELGEIGATFRKADIDALKAFITRDHDTMRRPYGEGDKRYPRRTALIASVDQTIYLHDTAGNRRFWTIPCTSINSYHDIDMQQVWAQVMTLVEGVKDKHGNYVVEPESWQLEKDEKEHIQRINEEHMQIEPIYELMLEKYQWGTPNEDYKSATKIGMELGLKNVTMAETRKIADCARKLGAEKEKGGQKRLKIPYLRFIT